MKNQRIDKLLANSGFGSRSEVRLLIKSGKVIVNNKLIKDVDFKVDADSDEICVTGKILNYNEFVYYMLNKPAGVVSATNDNTCKTVLELLHVHNKDLFPVGRLDKDTEGLLIITNDGPLAHDLLSPKKHIDKTYYVKTDKEITDEMAEILEKGVDIGEEKLTLPARIELIYENHIAKEAMLTITEGKFHQVKRMFKAVGLNVTFLKRISMGKLLLDESLKPGEYRALTESEISLLKNRD